MSDPATPGSRSGHGSYGRLSPALLPVYSPQPRHSRLRKKKIAGFARMCLTTAVYLALAAFLVAAGYAMANAGVVLNVSIERRGGPGSHAGGPNNPTSTPQLDSQVGQRQEPYLEAHTQQLEQQRLQKLQLEHEQQKQLLLLQQQQQIEQHQQQQKLLYEQQQREKQQEQQQQQQQQHQPPPQQHVPPDKPVEHQPIAHAQKTHPVPRHAEKLPQHADPNPQLPSLYRSGLSALNINGREVRMADLDGLVTLITNVASECGYTASNYQELQKVYERYHDYGFEILAFPCNEFGEQEPKLNFEIHAAMKERFNVTFTLMSKIAKIQRHPVFNFLRENSEPLPSHEPNEEISWNFNKFLVGKHGHVLKRYPSDVVQHQLEIDVYRALIEE